MAFKESRVKEQTCPGCGKLLDAMMNMVDKAAPSPGDVTVCGYCGAALMLASGGELKKISDDELAAMALQAPKAFSLLVKMQNLIGLMRRGGTKSGCKD